MFSIMANSSEDETGFEEFVKQRTINSEYSLHASTPEELDDDNISCIKLHESSPSIDLEFPMTLSSANVLDDVEPLAIDLIENKASEFPEGDDQSDANIISVSSKMNTKTISSKDLHEDVNAFKYQEELNEKMEKFSNENQKYIECLLELRIHLVFLTNGKLSNDVNVQKLLGTVCGLIEIHSEYQQALCNPQTNISTLLESMIKFESYLHVYDNYIASYEACCGAIKRKLDKNAIYDTSRIEEILKSPIKQIPVIAKEFRAIANSVSKDDPNYARFQELWKQIVITLVRPLHKANARGMTGNNHKCKEALLIEQGVNGKREKYVILYENGIGFYKRKPRSFRSDEDCFIRAEDIQMEKKSAEQIRCYNDLKEMKNRIKNLKSQIKQKEERSRYFFQMAWFKGSGIEKNLHRQEIQYRICVSYLPLKICNRTQNKLSHVLLFSSDFEREEWIHSINKVIEYNDAKLLGDSTLSLDFICNGSSLKRSFRPQSPLSGSIEVHILELTGLQQPTDVKVMIEVDSFGQISPCAPTVIQRKTTNAIFNELFHIELDCATFLIFLVYRVNGNENESIIGHSKLKLKQWITTQHISLDMDNGMNLLLTVRFLDINLTIHRLGTKRYRRNRTKIGTQEQNSVRSENEEHLFIYCCVRQIELRGLKETGIYRICTSAKDMEKLKYLFESDLQTIERELEDKSPYLIANLLKQYLRELNEPLFTNNAYGKLMAAARQDDAEKFEQSLVDIISQLPETNKREIIYIIDHLLNVAQQSSRNLMSKENLAMIFGPTLIRPAPTEKTCQLNMANEIEQSLIQSHVVLVCMNLRENGEKFAVKQKKGAYELVCQTPL